MRGCDGNYGIPTGLKSQCFSVRVRAPLPREVEMHLQKQIDNTQCFFIIINLAKSKKTKTYPRIRGTFTLQKEKQMEFSQYLAYEKTRGSMESEPLTGHELRDYWKLYDKFSRASQVYYFVFDVKRESHCRIECLASTKLFGSKKIEGMYWQNNIYQGMMKDQKSLRTLSNTNICRLFDKEWFWGEVLSQYVFAILKL